MTVCRYKVRICSKQNTGQDSAVTEPYQLTPVCNSVKNVSRFLWNWMVHCCAHNSMAFVRDLEPREFHVLPSHVLRFVF
jgi:hypothetical protein